MLGEISVGRCSQTRVRLALLLYEQPYLLVGHSHLTMAGGLGD